jgi:hypothetical protein
MADDDKFNPFHHHDDDDDCKCEKLIAASIREAGDDIQQGLLEIAQALRDVFSKKAVIARLSYSIGGNMPGNVLSGIVGNTASPTFTEAAADGSLVAPIGPVVYTSDNPAVVSVDANTGVATLVAANPDGSPATANVSALDQGNGLTDVVVFTVSAAPPPPAVSATLSYQLNPSRRR